MLARTFHECDLLVAEIVRAGSARRSRLRPISPRSCRSWCTNTAARSRRLRRGSRQPTSVTAGGGSPRSARSCGPRNDRVGLAEHRAPDRRSLRVAHAWVAGEGFAEVVSDEELTGGDFVRTIKQLIDLLRQLSLIVAPVARHSASGGGGRRGGVPRRGRRQFGADRRAVAT